MTRRMKSKWFLAGICSFSAMLCAVNEVRAASTISSITIKGGYKPGGGDPPYDYIFQVYLDAPSGPGTNTWVSSDSFTIEGLPGVNGSSTHSEPFQSTPPTVLWSAGASNEVFPPSPPAPAPYASDFTWVYSGTTVYTATTPTSGPMGASVLLGTFTIDSSYQDFTIPPFPNNTPVVYTYTGAPVGVTLTFPIMDLSVPEPSSAILLSVGFGGMLPVFWLAKRRRSPIQRPMC
jgi:hypothetical protein